MPTKSEIIEKLRIAIEESYSNNQMRAEAAFNALSEYVTFLEEGSEPQVGDIISGIVGNARVLQEVIDGAEPAAIAMQKRGCKIIAKGGKPVITLQKE